jgi:hypothetical protein
MPQMHTSETKSTNLFSPLNILTNYPLLKFSISMKTNFAFSKRLTTIFTLFYIYSFDGHISNFGTLYPSSISFSFFSKSLPIFYAYSLLTLPLMVLPHKLEKNNKNL